MNDSTQGKRGEALYLAVYEHVADKADYLQPSEYRQFLPEAAIAAAVGAAFSGIIEGLWRGFIERLGEKGADYALSLRSRLAKGKASSEEISVIAIEIEPMLADQTVNWDELTACVALELTRSGFSFRVSQQLAIEISADIKANR